MSVFFTGAVIIMVMVSILTFPILYHNVFILIPGVAKYASGDVLNRYVLLTIILTIWGIYPRLRLNSIKFGRLTVPRLKIAALAMLSGCLLIGSFLGAKLLMGQGYIDFAGLARLNLFKTLAWYLLGAVIVSIVEEILFRGVALQVYQQDNCTSKLAIPISALLFAAVHFVDFSQIAGTLLEKGSIAGAFVNIYSSTEFLLLAVLGVLLACAREYANTLYAAIGLHAGIVFALRLSGKIYKAYPGYSFNFFKVNGVDSVIIISIVALGFMLVRLLPRDRCQPRKLKLESWTN